MSEQNPERSGLPAIIERRETKEITSQKLRVPWLNLIVIGCVGIAIYGMFFRGHHSKPEAPNPPAGWLDLLGCTETRSFDGTKWLSLSEDRTAALHEQLGKPTEQLSKGEWSYDETAKTYAITINGQMTNYFVFNQQDIPGCMLVRGNLNEANLLESWFATMDGRDDDYGPGYDEAHEPH